ncbi:MULTISPECIES: hypothetical protein [unclassified Microcoleus]|uniref:hypothetical protein n=1 Tax=unclassified Microcoleus TaxID=2642155 RepID=UPI002FD077FB
MTVSHLERAIVEAEIRPDQCGSVRFQRSWLPAPCDRSSSRVPLTTNNVETRCCGSRPET